MKYDVLTDEQIEAMSPKLAPGVYSFEVADAKEKTSKSSGNEMIELRLKVWDGDGREHAIFDYLVGTPSMAWKIKRFWESVSEPEKYNGESHAHDFLNKCGYVKTRLEKDSYGEKAKVAAYVKKDELSALENKQQSKPVSPPSSEFVDDDIPW